MSTSSRRGSRGPTYPLCLIPAKGRSVRFPRKNIALLQGRPVIGYVISCARDSGIFDTIYVSTEDAEIASIARAEGATVLDRPAELATDEAPVTSVAIHSLDVLAQRGKTYDPVSVIYPTAALMIPEDIRGGWKLFEEKRANAVIAMTEYYEHPLHAYRKAGQYLRRAFPKASGLQTKLPAYQVPSGYFYMIRSELLRERKGFAVPRLVGYPIPRDRSVDIDEPEHLDVADALMSLMKRKAS